MPTRPIGIFGPRSRILSTFHFATRPFAFFQECAARYGDPFTLFLDGTWVVVTGDPEAARAIFALDPDITAAFGVQLVTPLIGERALLAISGEPHKRDRKLLGPSFHGARMRAYGDIIQKCTERFTMRWPRGRPFILQETTQAISLEVIIKAVFGVLDAARAERFHHATFDFINAFTPSLMLIPMLRHDLLGLSPWRRFRRAQAALDALLYMEIAERRNNYQERADILSLMIAARYEDGSQMSDAELRSALLTLLLAGHETTAISLTWALYQLARSPEPLRRLRQELDALGAHPDPEEIAKLPYLEAVCNETLRLYPIGPWVLRQLLQPMQLKGHSLPAGITVAASISLIHMRPDLYPEPARFFPERFLQRKYAPSEFLPFGGGNRRCLGAAFALYEMKLVLGTIVSRYDLRLTSDREVLPKRRNLTLGPAGGVEMILAGERLPAAAN